MRTNVVPFSRGPKPRRKAKSGHSLEHDLSFVRLMPKQIGGYCYWSVTPQKDGEDGWKRGAALATEFLKFLAAQPTYGNSTLLPLIFADMPHPLTRLEKGFLCEISRAAMGGALLLHGEKAS